MEETEQNFEPGQPRQRELGRRQFIKVAGAGTAGGALLAAGAGTLASRASASATQTGFTLPALAFSKSSRQAAFGPVYQAALTNVTQTNCVYADPGEYNNSGLITYPPGTIVVAGQGYPLPQRWTRDASVNTWSAASLLSPVIGRNTLWSVVDAQDGGLIVQQNDGEWWDQIVWVVSAWNHYLVTGDRTFLGKAYKTSLATMNARRTQNFNQTLGLFEGPGFMNDGISAYPSPPFEPGIDSSSVLSYPYVDVMMCLSTNCLYYGAYRALAAMARELGKSSAASRDEYAATLLRKAINAGFWRSSAGTYGYLIHGAGDPMAGQLDTHQEGGGLALAIILGVATAKQAGLILETTRWEPHGVVNVWPNFSWFDTGAEWGRQASLWPMVHGMFGHAAALGRRLDLFARALTELASVVSASNDHFWEVYNPVSGVPDGGWQTSGSGTIGQWGSAPDQTWSASSYLRMIYYGLFGLTFTLKGLQFAPSLPAGWGTVSLTGLRYRNSLLDITLTGAGNRVKSVHIDGRPSAPLLRPSQSGHHRVQIALVS